MKPGATGEFPEGQLSPNDEGELIVQMAYDPNHKVVVVNFGKPVAWFALTPDKAVELGQLLIEHAKQGSASH